MIGLRRPTNGDLWESEILRVAVVAAALALAAGFLLLLCLAGCAAQADEAPFVYLVPDARLSPGPLEVGAWTPGRVWYVAPGWAAEPEIAAGLEREIDEACAAEGVFDQAIQAEPGLFALKVAAEVWRVAGVWDARTGVVRVAWRSCGEVQADGRPLYLPALRHELRHPRCLRETGDADPGHVGCAR